MYILAFETSCDDTSIALFQDDTLLSMETMSQIKIHQATSWVVPEVAAREHANNIFVVLEKVLSSAKISIKDIDYIAVTTHPWLLPSLLTGVTVAGMISQVLHIPIIAINHIQSHIFSIFLWRKESEVQFPLLCLTASWGHTEIYYMENMFSFELIWGTQDDAAGEAFDKVAKMMWLEYPGGPIISQLAQEWEKRIKSWDSAVGTAKKKPVFPRVWLEREKVEFSFSWLKTAVKREIETRVKSWKWKLESLGSWVPIWEAKLRSQKSEMRGQVLWIGEWELSIEDKQEIAYEFSQAILEVLAEKLVHEAKRRHVHTISLAWGVSANETLRKLIAEKIGEEKMYFLCPTKKIYCVDNAAMIGIYAYYKIKYWKFETFTGVIAL